MANKEGDGITTPCKLGCNTPFPPQKPLDADCCGNGCNPCVFDIYEQELKIWKRECERIQNTDDKGAIKASSFYYIYFTIKQLYIVLYHSNAKR